MTHALTYRGTRIRFDDEFPAPTMGLAYFISQEAVNRIPAESIRIAPSPWWGGPRPGDQFYLSPWWVEVVSLSRKSRIVRYRKITRAGAPKAPIERMGRQAFERKARPA